MKKYLSLLLIGASFAATAGTALAADIIDAPVVIDAPEPIHVQAASGWYIRGDIGYVKNSGTSAEYVTYGPLPGGSDILTGKLSNGFSGGVGVGYQVTDYLRTELSADLFSSSKFNGSTTGNPCTINGVVILAVNGCASTDVDAYSALSLMANSYVDLGTYSGFTPYVGAGIGVTQIKWAGLSNTECEAANPANCNPAILHKGGRGMRASGQLMVGASYDVTCNLKADLGYRFRYTAGGRMFDFASNAGPGTHKGLTTHEVRTGLRWAIGGKGCGHNAVAYQPAGHDSQPVYK